MAIKSRLARNRARGRPDRSGKTAGLLSGSIAARHGWRLVIPRRARAIGPGCHQDDDMQRRVHAVPLSRFTAGVYQRHPLAADDALIRSMA